MAWSWVILAQRFKFPVLFVIFLHYVKVRFPTSLCSVVSLCCCLLCLPLGVCIYMVVWVLVTSCFPQPIMAASLPHAPHVLSPSSLVYIFIFYSFVSFSLESAMKLHFEFAPMCCESCILGPISCLSQSNSWQKRKTKSDFMVYKKFMIFNLNW